MARAVRRHRRTPGILAAEGVRYVVVHDDVYRMQGQPIPRLGKEFTLLRRFGDVRVYRLRAKPADLDRALERSRRHHRPAVRPRGRRAALRIGLPRGREVPRLQRQVALDEPGRHARPRKQGDKQIRAQIEGLAFSHDVLRRVELVDPAGRVVDSTLVDTFLDDFELGPVELPPERRGSGCGRCRGRARSAAPIRGARSANGEHLPLAPGSPAARRLLDEPAPAPVRRLLLLCGSPLFLESSASLSRGRRLRTRRRPQFAPSRGLRRFP